MQLGGLVPVPRPGVPLRYLPTLIHMNNGNRTVFDYVHHYQKIKRGIYRGIYQVFRVPGFLTVTENILGENKLGNR